MTNRAARIASLRRATRASVAALGLLAGCDIRGDHRESLSASDRVENKADTTHRVVVRIGVLEPVPLATYGPGAENQVFDVAGAVMIGDTVVIADRSSATLRYYGPGGGLARTVGRFGSGPGEFEQLAWIQHVRSRLYVHDQKLGRVTVFSESGSLVQSIPIRLAKEFLSVSPQGAFADGTIHVWALAPGPLPRAAETRLFRQQAVLLRFSAEGKLVDSIGSIKTMDIHVQPFGKNGQRMAPLVLGRATIAVANGDRVYAIENDNDRIIVWDETGRRRPPLRPADSRPRSKVTAEDIRLARAHYVQMFKNPQIRRGLLAATERMPIPQLAPFYGWAGLHTLTMMRATTGGDLWVLPFGGLQSLSPAWTVYGHDGELFGQVRSSAEVDLLDATREMALVLAWDAKGVEHVELHRIKWTQ